MTCLDSAPHYRGNNFNSSHFPLLFLCPSNLPNLFSNGSCLQKSFALPDLAERGFSDLLPLLNRPRATLPIEIQMSVCCFSSFLKRMTFSLHGRYKPPPFTTPPQTPTHPSPSPPTPTLSLLEGLPKPPPNFYNSPLALSYLASPGKKALDSFQQTGRHDSIFFVPFPSPPTIPVSGW